MIKNRPIREWLTKLPEPYRSKALDYFAKEENERQGSTAASMGIALAGAFAWGKTTEGYDYWHDMSESLTHQPA